jgi:hypothetical protein
VALLIIRRVVAKHRGCVDQTLEAGWLSGKLGKGGQLAVCLAKKKRIA